MDRVSCIAVVLVVASVSLAVAQTAGLGPRAGMPDVVRGPLHETATGATVPMPELASLDCGGMKSVLDRIDASAYRGATPLPEDHPDRVLFDYENALTARYFDECSGKEAVPRDPTAIFLRGFWSD